VYVAGMSKIADGSWLSEISANKIQFVEKFKDNISIDFLNEACGKKNGESCVFNSQVKSVSEDKGIIEIENGEKEIEKTENVEKEIAKIENVEKEIEDKVKEENDIEVQRLANIENKSESEKVKKQNMISQNENEMMKDIGNGGISEDKIKVEDKSKKVSIYKSKKIYVHKPKRNGIIYNSSNIKSFDDMIKNFYTVSVATYIKESDLNFEKAMKKKYAIKGDGSKPQILIYHTHSQEEFSNSKGKKERSIIGVGEYLATILKEQFGYNVIHDRTAYDVVNGKLDRNKAYDQSRKGVKEILKNNPSISLILDIHRDGVREGVRLVTTVNNKDTAQIMFFNGMSRFRGSGDIDYLYNPNLRDNLALSLQMKMTAEAYYPNFTRHNYINAYQYNLDLLPQCMLIEMGAQTNTFEEVKNACEPLAMIIHLTMNQ
jgi:stage II sporulation protein P